MHFVQGFDHAWRVVEDDKSFILGSVKISFSGFRKGCISLKNVAEANNFSEHVDLQFPFFKSVIEIR